MRHTETSRNRTLRRALGWYRKRSAQWEDALSTTAADLWYALLAGKQDDLEETLRRVALARGRVAEIMPDLERALRNNLGREVPSGQLRLIEER